MNKSLVALALAFFASTASAAISNSKHDFITNGYMNAGNLPATTCNFCHVPHHGSTATTGLPLWNTARSFTSPSTGYAGAGTTVDPKGTQTCLGCHATGTTTAMGTDNDMATLNPNAIVGTDLSNDHPVGTATIIPADTTMQATIQLGGLTITRGTTTVECSTCHEVHNSDAFAQAGTKLLRTTPLSTDFCLACHNK